MLIYHHLERWNKDWEKLGQYVIVDEVLKPFGEKVDIWPLFWPFHTKDRCFAD